MLVVGYQSSFLQSATLYEVYLIHRKLNVIGKVVVIKGEMIAGNRR